MNLPPLVAPAVALTQQERRRYSRHLLVPDVGDIGQRRLRNARVLVIGAGGLGSPVLQYLAAAGVGTLGIVDFDTVELSNLQRQVIHGVDDVGRSKVDSAAESLARIDPAVVVRRHEVRMDRDIAEGLVAEYDLVIDGTDNFATRYLVNDVCVLAGKPYVWGSVLRMEGQVSVFWAAHGPQYRDLHPTPPAAGTVPGCAEGGVLGVLCATIGSLMATQAVLLICGVGDPLLGRVLVYDALASTLRTVRFRPDPNGEPVTALQDYEQLCAAPSFPAGATVSPQELKRRLDAGEPLLLIDVREPAEREISSIAGAVVVAKDALLDGSAIPDLPTDRLIVLHCRSGVRSAQALTAVRGAGFTDAVHLEGGILAWIEQVDPSLIAY